MNSKISSKSRATKNVTRIVKKQLAIFEDEGERGKLLLRAVAKISIQYHLVAWYQNVFFQDVEELLPKLDHLYMIRAWTC
jgi:hypothetical protein